MTDSKRTDCPPACRRARAILLIGVVAAAALTVGVLAVGQTRQNIDRNTAITLATDFYAGAHEPGATVSQVQVHGVDSRKDDHGRIVWEINITGLVTESPTVSYGSAMILWVDAETGAVRVWAAG